MLASPTPQSQTLDPPLSEAAEVITKAVQYLSGVCDGALQLDGQGFNRFDSNFGKQLAERSQSRPLTSNELKAAYRMLLKYPILPQVSC